MKILRSIWAITSISLLSVCTNWINAQKATTRDAFIEKINASLDNQNTQNSDSIFNKLRNEAWSLKEDSLFVDLTFQ